MNPNLLQWAQSEEAQPYLQRYMPQQVPQPQGNGYSAGGGDYGMMLKRMFDANAGNPDLQRTLLGEYLNTISPSNQMDAQRAEQEAMLEMEKQRQFESQAEQERDMNILKLLDPADPQSGAIVDAILTKYGYGSAAQPQDSGYSSTWADRYNEMATEAPSQTDYGMYKEMAGFGPEQIAQYEAPISIWERLKKFPMQGLGGVFNGDQIRKDRFGY